MTDGRRMLMWAGTAFGSVYLAFVFAAGFLTANGAAWRFAVFSAGLAYLCTVAGVFQPAGSRIAFVLYLVTLASGAAAGLALLPH
jgi:hypothetical protein